MQREANLLEAAVAVQAARRVINFMETEIRRHEIELPNDLARSVVRVDMILTDLAIHLTTRAKVCPKGG